MPEFSTSTLDAIVFAVALAGCLAGATGFGFNLLATPILLVTYDAQVAVQVALMLGLVASSAVLVSPRAARELDASLLRTLVVWGLVGVPIGALVSANIDPRLLKAIIGSVITVYAVLVILSRGRPGRSAVGRFGPVAGVLSGVLAASTGLSGPPIVMYVQARRVESRYFRANLAAYVAVVTALSIVVAAVGGLIAPSTMNIAVRLGPATLVGTVSGLLLFSRIPARLFNPLVLAVLILTGVWTLLSLLS